MPAKTSSSNGHQGTVANAHTKYKGLFSHQMAPTWRAYLILFSFFVGILMITTGSVFCHVIQIRPMSGAHPIHTPSLPLACFLISAGIGTVLASFGIACRYGFDDGDDSLEDDLTQITKDDVLDQQHHQCCTKEDPPV